MCICLAQALHLHDSNNCPVIYANCLYKKMATKTQKYL